MTDRTATDTDALAAALAEVQAKMPKVNKGKTAQIPGKNGNPGYRYSYADLADVCDAVLPLLTSHGLAFSCAPRNAGGGYELAGVLLHTSGQRIEGALPLHGSSPQQIGSAITYARRYLIGCLVGVVTDDDVDAAPAESAARTRAYNGPSTEEHLEQIATDADRAGVTLEQALTKWLLDQKLTMDDVWTIEPERLVGIRQSIHVHAQKVVAEREAAEAQPGT